MLLKKFSFFLISFLLNSGGVTSTKHKISTNDNFIEFVNNVNSGTDDYSGTTIILDSDLSLSQVTEPIGKDKINYFLGIFDGQGHIISDLHINSTFQFTGLFGFSYGSTIRNVVLDSSCAITSAYDGSSWAFVGGIIGKSKPRSGQRIIENNVNMAEVTFSGNANGNSLYLGGVVGELSISTIDIYVKNCANYGSVTYSGTSSASFIGGVVANIVGPNSSPYNEYLYNSANYGTVMYSGTTLGKVYLGGVAGVSYYTYIENCVSAGKIITQSIPSKSYIGNIVGFANSSTHINYCYYASELSGFDVCGIGKPETTSHVLGYDNSTFELSGAVSVGSYTGNSLVDALNAVADYYVLRDYSKWLLNKEEKSVKFAINSRTSPITMNYRIILLPNLATEGNTFFDGWYNDNEYVNLLELFVAIGNVELYGRFRRDVKNYTITFDTRREGVTVEQIIAQFGTDVPLPSGSIRDSCVVSWWETDKGYRVGLSLVMPAHSITLYAVWKCNYITTPDDFVDFAKIVNSGTSYLGSTVFLDSDLSLSGKTLEPINYFPGTFDGQGHVINGLKMNSTSPYYTGLFGYSHGLIIKNVELDSSCSVTSSYRGTKDVYLGGIIGGCDAVNGECIVESSVNMGGVTFSGKCNYLYLGEIAGQLYSSSYTAHLKNCANYGFVAYSGICHKSRIGGIVGSFYGSSMSYKYLQNCLNYGTITYNGTSLTAFYLGGIIGYTWHTRIENCVSAGKISSAGITSGSNIGAIVGSIHSFTHLNQCYYTSDVGEYGLCGVGTPDSTTGTASSPSAVGSTLINALNEYASRKSWNKWLLNANNVSVSFTPLYGKGFTVNSQIILLPDLAKDGECTFSGWYKDANLTSSFISSQLGSEITLYGLFCAPNYVVTLDANGGVSSSHSISVKCNGTYGKLSTPRKKGHSFVGWFTEKEGGERIEAGGKIKILRNHVLYARWEEKTDDKGDPPLIMGIIVSVVVIVVVSVASCVFKRSGGGHGGHDGGNGNGHGGNDGNNGNGHGGGNDGGDNGGGGGVVINRRERPPFVAQSDEIEAGSASENSKGDLASLYPQGYKGPSMKDALLEARLTEEQTGFICRACNNVAKRTLNEGKLFGDFTKNDAAAIAMYTYDFGPDNFEHNPYRIINKSLVERNYESLQKASGLLYLVMRALRKLPRFTGKTLYRGVNTVVSLDNNHYHKGNTITWHALSSTSPNLETTEEFLAKGSKSRQATGTLFIIDKAWGYNIQPYSLFPDEEEIMLEPERQFKVTSVDNGDLTIINLEMLDTPLVLPEVFGEGNNLS